MENSTANATLVSPFSYLQENGLKVTFFLIGIVFGLIEGSGTRAARAIRRGRNMLMFLRAGELPPEEVPHGRASVSGWKRRLLFVILYIIGLTGSFGAEYYGEAVAFGVGWNVGHRALNRAGEED